MYNKILEPEMYSQYSSNSTYFSIKLTAKIEGNVPMKYEFFKQSTFC